MQHLHIVSHTHWDREWYQPFQLFRLKLVHLVDNLLTLLDSDPTYQHFMLDGQTIVLEDYLQMRMVNFPRLQQYIRENRILIGPWYILPDEFLVSPEATIRNLLIGKQICELFGQRMMVGYIPDPFGHISQMPQILNGFHMDTACLWRGVRQDAPTLLWWQAPDGSKVLLAHLYTSYSNIAAWPVEDPQQSLIGLNAAADALQPHNPVSHFLMMRGSDHLEPRPELPEHIRFFNAQSKERQAHHSTLPAYLAAATNELETQEIDLPTVQGELRDPRKAHMLPAVLSARMPIKQRNHAAQTLLERWVEPFCTWQELLIRKAKAFTPLTEFEHSPHLNDRASLIHQAWKLLISNHPHDSICGCSIDQVHREMMPRFDQVDQMGGELAQQALAALTSRVGTASVPANVPGIFAAIAVFNAAPYNQTGIAEVDVNFAGDIQELRVIDHKGTAMPCEILPKPSVFIESDTYPIKELTTLLTGAAHHGHKSRNLVNAQLIKAQPETIIRAVFSNLIEPDDENLGKTLQEITALVSSAQEHQRVRVEVYDAPGAHVRFQAKDVPAFGLHTFWVAKQTKHTVQSPDKDTTADNAIENAFLKLEITADGSLHLLDKRNGKMYSGINSYLDKGDRGDEYNYCPPEDDQVSKPQVEKVEFCRSPLEEVMCIHYRLNLPVALTADRTSRSKELINCPLVVRVSLQKDCPYIDFHVDYENRALDHRLEVRFPTGLDVDTARYDGHFDVIERPIDLPTADQSWKELPRPEVPQRTFTEVSDGKQGVMLANYGLPEVAVLRDENGSAQICLTLLRCVGWLSRDDMWTRQGQAGPPIPTPEAQELGKHCFDYRMIPHNGNWLKASTYAQTFQVPLKPLLTTLHQGSLSTRSQMIAVEPASFLVTAIKPSVDETGWVMRGVNLTGQPVQVSVQACLPVVKANLVHLDESVLEEVPIDAGNKVHLEVPAHRIISLLFRIED